jgi:hypothetical protein
MLPKKGHKGWLLKKIPEIGIKQDKMLRITYFSTFILLSDL